MARKRPETKTEYTGEWRLHGVAALLLGGAGLGWQWVAWHEEHDLILPVVFIAACLAGAGAYVAFIGIGYDKYTGGPRASSLIAAFVSAALAVGIAAFALMRAH